MNLFLFFMYEESISTKAQLGLGSEFWLAFINEKGVAWKSFGVQNTLNLVDDEVKECKILAFGVCKETCVKFVPIDTTSE